MSKKIILFSEAGTTVMPQLRVAIFPEFINERVFAYLPSDGGDTKSNLKYTPFWQDFVQKNNAKFVVVDNSKRGKDAILEKNKLLSSNILMISGGNTFTLLNHLRLSGLDKAIIKFWEKDNTILAGVSAGAIVLTPSIGTAAFADSNDAGLTDLTGLSIVDFEVWPHFTTEQQAELDVYSNSKKNLVIKSIMNDQLLIINK